MSDRNSWEKVLRKAVGTFIKLQELESTPCTPALLLRQSVVGIALIFRRLAHDFVYGCQNVRGEDRGRDVCTRLKSRTLTVKTNRTSVQ